MSYISFFIIISFILSSLEYIGKSFFVLDLGVLVLVEFSIYEKNLNKGILIVSLLGLIQDILTGAILGYNIFTKAIFFLIIFMLKEKLFFKNFIVKIFICWSIFIINEYLKLIFYKFFQFPIKNLNFYHLIPFLILTPLFLMIIYHFEKRFIKINET